MSASGAACSGSVDGFHLEYVRVQATQNVTIRNSVFVPDAGSGNGAGSGKIFVTSSSASSSAANGLKLIGNSFGTVKGSYSIQTHTNVQNANGWQIKNNTFAQPVMSPNLAAGAACGNTGPVAAPGRRPARQTPWIWIVDAHTSESAADLAADSLSKEAHSVAVRRMILPSKQFGGRPTVDARRLSHRSSARHGSSNVQSQKLADIAARAIVMEWHQLGCPEPEARARQRSAPRRRLHRPAPRARPVCE